MNNEIINMNFVRNRFEQGLIRSTISNFGADFQFQKISVSAAHRSFRNFRNPPLKKTKKTTAFSNLDNRFCSASGGSLSLRTPRRTFRSLQNYILSPIFLTFAKSEIQSKYIFEARALTKGDTGGYFYEN